LEASELEFGAKMLMMLKNPTKPEALREIVISVKKPAMVPSKVPEDECLHASDPMSDQSIIS